MRISGSYNLNNLPFFIADAKGYFQGRRPAGEDRELRPGRLKVLQALVANPTDVAVGFYDHTIQMQAKGKDGARTASRNSGLVMAGRDATFDPARRRPSRARRSGPSDSSSVTSSPARYSPTASR